MVGVLPDLPAGTRASPVVQQWTPSLAAEHLPCRSDRSSPLAPLARRHDGPAALVPFSFAHSDLTAAEIDVFDPQHFSRRNRPRIELLTSGRTYSEPISPVR